MNYYTTKYVLTKDDESIILSTFLFVIIDKNYFKYY